MQVTLICSPSSPTASKSSSASRARATISSMPCSRSKARTISLLIVRRVEALGKFLDTEDGKNLLAGYKRATNILRIEEKKDSARIHRRARSAALPAGRGKGAGARHRRRQGRGRRARSRARISPPPCAPWRSCGPHVDAFFDKVTVNVDDKAVAREPAEAAQRNPRRDARGGGFFQDRGLTKITSPRVRGEVEQSEGEGASPQF